MKKLITAITAIAIFAACNLSYQRSATGLVYKIFPSSSGAKLEAGKIVKMHLAYTIPAKKDSVIQSTFNSFPFYFPFDTTGKNSYDFREVLPKCKVGDSLIIIISVDSLKSKKLIPDYDNNFLVKGGSIKVTVKVLDMFMNDSLAKVDERKLMEAEKAAETKSMEAYIASKGYKTLKTKNGAYVLLEEPGDQTNKADTGMTASIMYRGYLQTDGKVFDTNMDTSKHHTDPYLVNVGSGGVVPGWEDALPYFGKGGKGKIFVPAFLGYGIRGNGPDLPPNANLVFDIHVIDVVKGMPPRPISPQMQNGPQGD